MDLTWQAWLTAGVITLMFGVLVRGRIPTDAAVLGALCVLVIAGVVSPAQAVAGFGNPAVATIGLLFALAVGLRETGAIALISRKLLKNPKTTLAAQARLVLPVALLSAFANNTPVVAAFMPMLASLSKRTGIPIGRLLMPLSFAAILGGLCTLIGTSTTLIVAGMLSAMQPDIAAKGGVAPEFGMFTIAPVGIAVAAGGTLYMLAFGRTLLPERTNEPDAPDTVREYMTAMRVATDSPIVGHSIERAGLRHLPGLFLSRVDRGDEAITAVPPQFRIRAGDVLVFVGALESVVELQQLRGLIPVADGDEALEKHKGRAALTEAVVSPGSPLVGRSVRDAGIRTRYSAVVIAVHRLGERLEGKVGDIVLRPGDTLLLETADGFAERFQNSTEFHLVSERGEGTPRHERAWISLGILGVVVLALSIGLLQPLAAAMLGVLLMVTLRCCTVGQARRGVDWSVLLVIGGAFGLGAAMDNTGLAAELAHLVVVLAEGAPPIVLIALLYGLTVGFTTFITNAAAAALIFPIGVGVALEADIPLLPVALCVAIASSAEFTTPLGYHTNLMVMGPGGYRFVDYVRFGGPMTLLAGAITVVTLSLFYV